MFNATELLIDAFVARLSDAFRRNYGSARPAQEGILAWVGAMALENIANSDALYHDVEHTILVTLVGQEVLRGKHISEGGVSANDWFQCILSLICHDIGYVRGVLRGDGHGRFATGRGTETLPLPPGASDAALTPYHVDRGKMFVEERFGGHEVIDCEVIKRNIELTRFPVPDKDDHAATHTYPALIRASDLIGQLSDPRYLHKINRLYGEFQETGVSERLKYANSDDLRRNYPRFYWSCVYPYIQDALYYLDRTQQGKQIVANLYANVFLVEHAEQFFQD